MMPDKNRKEVIRTVRGDIQPAELGRTNVHEHLLMRSPLLRGEELDDLERSAAEASEMHNTGIDALVELTPIGLGRDPRGIVKIAELSGLQIVLATGIHQQAHYSPEHWIYRIGTDKLARLFIRDSNEGCDGADYGGPSEQPTTIRAGVIKVGAGYWRITPLERRVFGAAGKAHRARRTNRLLPGNGQRSLRSVGYPEGRRCAAAVCHALTHRPQSEPGSTCRASRRGRVN
jgi:predicted metal-dependent phosphotriesterase family hydrolase